MTLLKARDIDKTFAATRSRGPVRAVHRVSLELAAGEVLGIVGESGSGKSTLGRCLALLTPADSGEIWFKNSRIDKLRGAPLREFRTSLQFVFQDPAGSLNPRLTIGRAIAEPLMVHSMCAATHVQDRVDELLGTVDLPADLSNRFPHELSGGEMQRAGIARALAVEPEIMILDEPFSALDVSVQAQLLDLFERLKTNIGLAYLVISHDLGVVAQIADRVAVMFRGEIVETGDTAAVLQTPLHPYTGGLVKSIPSTDPAHHRTLVTTSKPLDRPDDALCAFHFRCDHELKDETCRIHKPTLDPRANRSAACHHAPGHTGPH